MHYLSKSKLISGWQCPKRLWLERNAPDAAQVSAQTQAAFDTGHRVGAAAQAQFPGGILIGHDQELGKALEQTAQLLDEPGPVTLFEATFSHDGILVRADVLVRNEFGQLRLIEVKASAALKDYHLLDCAIQLWVLQNAGLNVVRVDLAHINKDFVYPGNGNYAGLFAYENVTAAARERLSTVLQLVGELRTMLDAGEPQVPMGAHCTRPFDCPFTEHCYREAYGPDPDWPVQWLPGGRTLHNRLIDQGYRDIRDIPEGVLGNKTAEWCRRVTLAGEAELKPAAAEALGTLGWPRYYFDFETLAPAVPVFAGTSPYTMQAFQWSCHVEYADGTLEHREFLPDAGAAGGIADAEPPMRACAEALIAALDDAGPVFMYTGYEVGVLKNLIALFPELEAPLQAIRDRLVDLHPITRANYCHPDLRGSWSIKKVLPTVAPDLSYEGLDIVSVGTDAEVAFLEMIHSATPADRAHELRAALLRYCKLDTEAMVRLARLLEGRG